MARHVMAPVARLARQVRHRDQLDAGTPPLAPEYPEDEIGHLAAAFDGTLGQLRRSIERERLFTSDVSHELRTPLMIIATSSELLLESPLHASQRDQVGRIERAAREMSDLVRTFLMLARSDSVSVAEEDTMTLAEVAHEQCERWGAEIRSKGLDFELAEEGASSPAGHNATLLRTVMANLLRNALHYTTHGQVRLVLEKDGFRIEDTGMGVSVQEQSRIFEPFVRGSQARGEGLGLGLSLVQRICEHQGWEISASSQQSQGSCFRVSFRGTS
jgi:signal transduction histidine kinase